jgi:flavin-dependent dehydrogenase
LNAEVVIVGAGLTGMSVSKTLAHAGIDHTMIGSAPDDRPKLGESLNLEGTLLLDQFCGDYHRFMGPKMAATAYVGDQVVYCGFDVAGKAVSRVFYKLLGTSAPSEFHHIDRIGMDNAMWADTMARPQCHVLDDKIESVRFNAATDKVEAIELSSGVTLEPRIVFDCTNHRRVIAQAAEVPVQTLGPPQRVIYTHYHPPGHGPVVEPRPAYDLATNQIRLFPETDGIDAVAWYIPLPQYLSIGVSMTADSNDLSDDEVLTCVARAYAARGMHYEKRYPERAAVMTLHHRYYSHERGAGANWMLAGGTYASVWWMSGAGVGTSFVAGRMAADFVADPVGVGARYGSLLKNLVPIHGTFSWMATVSLAESSHDGMRAFSDGFIRTNVIRLAKSAQLHRNAVPRACGRLLEVLVDREMVLKDYCDVVTAPRGEQTAAVFGPEPGSAAAASAQALVLRLADVISGRAPIDEVESVLAPDVVSHLDGIKVKGVGAWRTWLGYLRSRADDLELIDAEVVLESDGRLALTGRWRRGGPGGETSESVAAAWYKVRNGRIVEIWTKSSNYTFVLGPMMAKWYGKYAASAGAGLWKRRRR